jgi:hypothetical protein
VSLSNVELCLPYAKESMLSSIDVGKWIPNPRTIVL